MDVSELETLYSLPSPAVLTLKLMGLESSSNAVPSSISEVSHFAEEEDDSDPLRRDRRGTDDCTAGMLSSTAGVIATAVFHAREKREEPSSVVIVAAARQFIKKNIGMPKPPVSFRGACCLLAQTIRVRCGRRGVGARGYRGATTCDEINAQGVEAVASSFIAQRPPQV